MYQFNGVISEITFLLWICGLWPSTDNFFSISFYSIFSLFMNLWTLVYLVSQLIMLFFIYDDFEAFTRSLTTTGMNVVTMMKVYYFIRFWPVLKALLADCNQNEVFKPRNDRHLQIVYRGFRKWKIWLYVFVACCIAAILSKLTFVIANGHILPEIGWFPYDTKTSPAFEISFVFQAGAIIIKVLDVITIDFLVCAFFTFVIVQCEILCDVLLHMYRYTEIEVKAAPPNSVDLPGPEELDQEVLDSLPLTLGRCILHHKEIVRFLKTVKNWYDVALFLQFCESTTTMCFTMFKLSTTRPSSHSFFIFLTTIICLYQKLAILCYFGNEVTAKSQQIPIAAFHTCWVYGSERFRKDILFFIRFTQQRPLELRTLNLFPVNLETYTTIVRTSFSYLTVLKSVNRT